VVQKNCEKMIQTIIRIILAIGVFFIYKLTWQLGTNYLGLTGGIVAWYSSITLVYKIDHKIFYIANSAWFLYKGLGVLKGIEDRRLLCLLLINEKKFTEQGEGLFLYKPIKLFSEGLAALIMTIIHQEPASESSNFGFIIINNISRLKILVDTSDRAILKISYLNKILIIKSETKLTSKDINDFKYEFS